MSVKISELPILDSLADNDVIAGVDTSANVTSKIEMATLKNYIDTNTQYTAGTNIDITNNVVSAPNVYNKTETDGLIDDLETNINEQLEEKDEQIEELQSEVDSLSTIYNAFPTESGEGESLTLDDTAEVKFKKFDLKGNTSQTTYSGKNLFDKDNANILNAYFETSTPTLSSNDNARTLYIECLPNTTYTITKLRGQQFNVGCTNTKPIIGTTIQKIENGPLGAYDGTTKASYTYTTNSTAKYLLIRYAYTTQVDLDLMLSSIQIEYGSSATSYEPYVGGTPSPNPSYPQPVNVVSGDNEIVVNGKNLLITNGWQNATISPDGSFIYANDRLVSGYIPITSGTTKMVLSVNTSLDFIGIAYYDEEKIYISRNAVNDNNKVVGTIPNNAKFVRVFINTANVTMTINSFADYEVQIEYGENETTYEAPTNNIYNIDLPVENLLPISSLASTTSNGITFTNNNDGTYTLNGTATAEATFYIFGGNTEIKANSKLTFSCKELIGGTRIFWYDNWATISGAEQRIGSGKPNYTTTNEITTISQLRVNVSVVSGTTVNNLTIKPMLQKGTKANSYTPYGTTPIELCKIGNYQDYFGKSDGRNLLDTNVFGNRLINCYVVNNDKTITQTASDANFWNSSYLPHSITLNQGTYTISVSNRNGSTLQIYNLTTSSNITERKVDSYTFTLTNDNQVINVKLYGASSYPFTFTMQLEKGSSATPYQPYGVGKWYLHKEINKVVFSNVDYGSLSTYYDINAISIAKTQLGWQSAWTSGVAIMDKYSEVTNASSIASGTFATNLQQGNILIFNSAFTDIATARTTLEGTILYIRLATPTITEITYQPLIDQLNLLEQAMSKDGQTNISQVSNDKPFILDVTAIKSLQNILDRIELLES